MFNNSVRTVKKIQVFAITKINLLTLRKEIFAVYSENNRKRINEKRSFTDCQSRRGMPLDFKELKHDRTGHCKVSCDSL
jgi:hypothetical protein